MTCRVDGEDGRPVEGALVQLLPLCVDREPYAPVFGRTDASGAADLPGLPPGPAVLVARKRGFDRPGSKEWTGRVVVVPIGAPPDLAERVRSTEP